MGPGKLRARARLVPVESPNMSPKVRRPDLGPSAVGAAMGTAAVKSSGAPTTAAAGAFVGDSNGNVNDHLNVFATISSMSSAYDVDGTSVRLRASSFFFFSVCSLFGQLCLT